MLNSTASTQLNQAGATTQTNTNYMHTMLQANPENMARQLNANEPNNFIHHTNLLSTSTGNNIHTSKLYEPQSYHSMQPNPNQVNTIRIDNGHNNNNNDNTATLTSLLSSAANTINDTTDSHSSVSARVSTHNDQTH